MNSKNFFDTNNNDIIDMIYFLSSGKYVSMSKIKLRHFLINDMSKVNSHMTKLLNDFINFII